MILHEHRIVTSSSEETLRFGTYLGQQLKSGDIVALNGELGAGKTCLTQGIARGLDVPKGFYVTSPSFALVNQYPGRTRLFHIDFYRMEDSRELDDVGLNEILAEDGIVVIEWADKFPSVLPRQRLDVSLIILDDQTRELNLSGSGHRAAELLKICFKYVEPPGLRERP